ncbi:MAG: hypothetical protein KME13_24280 [Myxacorys californica WJT36-NPBG1]|jgi:hypothetical protein|nr:hypothetical protein [Myxacorys californica WJT36-NPBG1]
MTESEVKPDWKQTLIAQAGSIKITTWIPVGVGLGLCAVIWYRDFSKPAQIEDSASNPARAATPDRAATQSGEFSLPDQLNLMFQQQVYDRAQQIKADVARETANKSAPCFKLSPTSCVELKLQDLNRKLAESISPDGTMLIGPSRALAFNVEAHAMLAAMQGLGAKDEATQRLTQIYLPAAQAGDSGVVNGVASTVQSLELYLSKRKVDRLAATGQTEKIPERKRIGNVRAASLGN